MLCGSENNRFKKHRKIISPSQLIENIIDLRGNCLSTLVLKAQPDKLKVNHNQMTKKNQFKTERK